MLVLPVALLLIMAALSLVSRSNSGAITSTQESRAQAARMAAEYGFSQLMAQVNTEYDSSSPTPLVIGNQISIPDSSGASYKIVGLDPSSTTPAGACSGSDIIKPDLLATIEGSHTVGAVHYKRTILRTLKVCAPSSDQNQRRVRGFE